MNESAHSPPVRLVVAGVCVIGFAWLDRFCARLHPFHSPFQWRSSRAHVLAGFVALSLSRFGAGCCWTLSLPMDALTTISIRRPNHDGNPRLTRLDRAL